MLFDHFSSLYFASSSPWLPGILPVRSSEETIINNDSTSAEFSWDNIAPNKSLHYHDCFGDYQCARLQVPMDWTNLSDPRTVDIAVIRLPATVPVTSPSYAGPVIINPGGPGGSGVNFALVDGKPIRTVVGAGPENNASDSSNSTARHFDVISFDPRGVNNTTPHFVCFPDSIQMNLFNIEASTIGAVDASDAAYGLHWAKMRGVAKDCSQRALDSGIGEFVTTPNVVRDIIEIVERHGEWREHEARRLLSESTTSRILRRLGLQEPLMRQGHIEALERTKHRPGEEQVQYWGFSYGSILGATLAAMYPERMARVVLDGVADSFDYMEGGWRTNLQDTDMQLIKFGEYCWLGGPKNCPMYHEDGPAAITGNISDIVNGLKDNPITVPASDGFASGIVSYSDLKQVFFKMTYSPLGQYHSLATILKDLSQGNGTLLIQGKRQLGKLLENGLSEKCKKDGSFSKSCFDNSGGFFNSITGAAIMCTDAPDQTNITREEYWEYVEELLDQSQLLGDIWAFIRMPCTQWNIRPKWRYDGNYTATTGHPVLFVSNTLDNVTPIRNAVRMSKGFTGSVILQQDTEGHCSASGVSFCTMRGIREYFQTGKLPEKGTICAPDRLPLDGINNEKEPKLPEGETDVELWKAMLEAALH